MDLCNNRKYALNKLSYFAIWLWILVLAMSDTSSLAGVISHTVHIDTEQLTIKTVSGPDGNDYTLLSMPDTEYIGEPGSPMVPYKFVRFLVPTYSQNFSVTMSDYEIDVIKETDNICQPIYPSITTNQSPDENFFGPLIEQYENWQSHPVIGNSFLHHGCHHIVSVGVPVCNLKNASKIIEQFSTVTIRLNYEECSPEDVNFIPLKTDCNSTNCDLSEWVVNSSQNTDEITRITAPYQQVQDLYYILTPAYLKPSVEKIASWERQKGYKVSVVTVEEILRNPIYDEVDSTIAVDDASKIRNWLIVEEKRIAARLGAAQPFHLFIIGDEYAGTPIRKFANYHLDSSKTYDYWGEKYIPSDTYFSDITSKFILKRDGNGFFAPEVDSTEMIPCSQYLNVGRLLGYSDDHLSNYLRKLLIYEMNPGLGDTNYLRRGVETFQYDMRKEEMMLDQIPGITEVFRVNDEQIDENTFEANRPTGSEVLEIMKKCGFISMHGHGSIYTIAVAGQGVGHNQRRYIQSQNEYDHTVTIFDHKEVNNGLDKLNNASYPGFFYSIACNVMPFDNAVIEGSVAKKGLYNLGSAYTVAGHYGGVAFVGNTRNGYISTSAKLGYTFGKYINKYYTIGEALNISTKMTFSGDYSYCTYSRNIIGDPSLKIWTQRPIVPVLFSCEIENKNLITYCPDYFNVRISLCDGTDNVALYIPNPTYSNSRCILPLDKTTNTDFLVSIYKEGYQPFFKLYANNSYISNNRHKRYFVNECCLNSHDGNSCFTIEDKGILTINSTDTISTLNAFHIQNEGNVNLTALKQISLSNDIIESDGLMKVEAPCITLGPGFSVAKGGCLILTGSNIPDITK